jgi:hypothetical protein
MATSRNTLNGSRLIRFSSLLLIIFSACQGGLIEWQGEGGSRSSSAHFDAPEEVKRIELCYSSKLVSQPENCVTIEKDEAGKFSYSIKLVPGIYSFRARAYDQKGKVIYQKDKFEQEILKTEADTPIALEMSPVGSAAKKAAKPLETPVDVAPQATVEKTPPPSKENPTPNPVEPKPSNEGCLQQLSNGFLGKDVSLALKEGSQEVTMVATESGKNTQSWKLFAVDNEYYRLCNQSAGDGYALTPSNGGRNLHLEATNSGNDNQSWKLQAQQDGTYRLINKAMGESRALDTYSDSHEPFMGETNNVSGQFWQIDPSRICQ